jgi:hypothetical protein
MWPNQMGGLFGGTLVNHVRYVSGPLRWVGYWVQYSEGT